jgi:heme-degrading monooxygenase HmoA
MHAVIRNYAGAPNLVSELTKRAAEVESIINTVPGFISYYLLKTRVRSSARVVPVSNGGRPAAFTPPPLSGTRS